MPVFALYNFNDTDMYAFDSALGNGAQDGIYLNGAQSVAGQAVLDGQNDLVKIYESEAFQLDRGTLEINFAQTGNFGTGPNTILSRDSVGETPGGFHIDVLADGSVQVVHESAGSSTTFTSQPGLVVGGQDINITYSWDVNGTGALQITSTDGQIFNAEVPAGLTMDMGDDINQSWFVGAGQSLSNPGQLNDVNQHFGAEVEFFSISDTVDNVVDDGGRDGIVTGTTGDDLIDTAYTGDNDGDFVDNNDALLPGAAPNDDTVIAREGNDTVYSGAGDDSVEGGAGDDLVYGGVGNDTELGGIGDDTLSGESGNDVLTGGDGSDSVVGGSGDDLIDTSAGGLPAPDRGYPGLYTGDTDPLDDRDTVDGGRGNDTISTGDDNDSIRGGAGNDSINAGVDDDTITGDRGNDTIIGGEGSDLISGGQNDDLIYGGLAPTFPDAVNIPDATDLRPDNGRDTIDGGLGNDTIYGEDDDDSIHGGFNDDVIYGGIDEDTIFGDRGNDTLSGGAGVDTIYGGGDRDVILGGNAGDYVNGNESGDDFDVLDLTGSGPVRITYTSADREDGTVDFLDADGNSTGQLTFENIENVIPCFTPGTLIATPKGEVPVESLKAGDRVITRDNGIQEISWTGARALEWHDLARNPHLQPVLIRRGSLGDGLPEQDMMVSPNHRMLVANDRTALHFDEHEVLVAAKHLVGTAGVLAVDSIGTTYLHFMFERHEVVLANGAWTESFQPGDYTLKGMGNAQRAEIYELFPELKTEAGLADYGSARRTLKKHEARLLMR